MPKTLTHDLQSSWLLPVLIITLPGNTWAWFWNQEWLGTIPKRLFGFGSFNKVGGFRGLDKLCAVLHGLQARGDPPSMFFFSSTHRALVTKMGQGLLWWGPASAWHLLISGILSILWWKYLILGNIYLFKWSGYIAECMANTSSYSWFLNCTPFCLE